MTSLFAAQGRSSEGIALARRGLLADPNDAPLLENLSYLLANDGDLVIAERLARKAFMLEAIRLAGPESATLGLIAMKRLAFELGDAHYVEALAIFEKQKRPDLFASCFAYYARAAVSTGHSSAEAIVVEAVGHYLRSPSFDAAVVLGALREGDFVAITNRARWELQKVGLVGAALQDAPGRG